MKLAAEHGLHRTARTLKLDYYSLKKRTEAAEGRQEGNGPTFLELSPALAAVQECVIELEDGAVSLRVTNDVVQAASPLRVHLPKRHVQCRKKVRHAKHGSSR